MSGIEKQLEETGYCGTQMPQPDKELIGDREFLLYQYVQAIYTRFQQLTVKQKENMPLAEEIAALGAVLKEYKGVKRKHVPPTKFTTVKTDSAILAMYEMDRENRRKKPEQWQMGKPIDNNKPSEPTL